MNIIMFGHKRIPSREGGVEIVVEELGTRMVQKGHKVLCYNRGGHHVSGAQFDVQLQNDYKGVQIKRVWTMDRKGLAAVTSSFCAAVCSVFNSAKVVHIHSEGPAFMCWLPKLFRKRVIVTVHGLDWQREKWKNGFASKYIHLGDRITIHPADEIIVLSRNVQDYFFKTYGRRTVWIPNGVTPPSSCAANHITEQWGLKKDDYILFLGRLVPEKGVHYLIEAYKNVSTDKRLVIAGGLSDSEAYVQQLKKQAETDDRIMFTDFVQGQALSELFSNAYVYVLPSDVEGMPLSLLEAMSYGNCCLVSDIPECVEIIEDKAIVFPRGNIVALTERLQELCDHDDLVINLKNTASDFVCNKYSWNDVVKKTLELYQ